MFLYYFLSASLHSRLFSLPTFYRWFSWSIFWYGVECQSQWDWHSHQALDIELYVTNEFSFFTHQAHSSYTELVSTKLTVNLLRCPHTQVYQTRPSWELVSSSESHEPLRVEKEQTQGSRWGEHSQTGWVLGLGFCLQTDIAAPSFLFQIPHEVPLSGPPHTHFTTKGHHITITSASFQVAQQPSVNCLGSISSSTCPALNTEEVWGPATQRTE